MKRVQNRRQTVQSMCARLEKGYHVFYAPIGYRYEKDKQHGKLLVRQEPVASLIQEALEGFAIGRFQTQAEIKRFLESQPDYPKDLPGGQIRAQRVHDLVHRSVYAGMVEAPNWGISLRKGLHEGLISLEMYQKIQERLKGTAKAPARADLNADFPMRGFVRCACCDKPMTACWSRSKTGKSHAHYWCKTRGCPEHRKSIKRAELEGAIEEVLHDLQPGQSYTDLITAMFKDAWDARLAQANEAAKSLKTSIAHIDHQIDGLLDRVVETTQSSVITAYEARIAKLEEEKQILTERAAKPAHPTHPFAEMFEISPRFPANCYEIWRNAISTGSGKS